MNNHHTLTIHLTGRGFWKVDCTDCDFATLRMTYGNAVLTEMMHRRYHCATPITEQLEKG